MDKNFDRAINAIAKEYQARIECARECALSHLAPQEIARMRAYMIGRLPDRPLIAPAPPVAPPKPDPVPVDVVDKGLGIRKTKTVKLQRK